MKNFFFCAVTNTSLVCWEMCNKKETKAAVHELKLFWYFNVNFYLMANVKLVFVFLTLGM